MSAAVVDLRGAELAIIAPRGQAISLLFDFGAVDVSAYTWRGQVRREPDQASADAAFTFANPEPTQLLATIAAPALVAGVTYRYEIEQTAPTPRQMFYGSLTIKVDHAR